MSDLIFIVVTLGVAMIVAARIARRRGEDLKRAGATPWAAARASTLAQWSDLTFFGPLPRALESLGRFLAIGVIVFVAAVLVLIFVAIVYASYFQ